MKALVVYDSVFGNTEKIARAISDGLAEKGQARLLQAAKANLADLKGIDLLVVGAPTQGGRPTPAVQEFLKAIPSDALKNVKIATFDTRITRGGTGKFAKIFGFAAKRIESELKRRGAAQVSSEGFAVKGREGPLEDGEVERAKEWAKRLLS
jgi:flavodoxin